MRFTCLFLILLVSLGSCRKEEEILIEPIQYRDSVFYRVETQTTNGEYRVFYQYDQLGRLIMTQADAYLFENYRHDRFGNVIYYEYPTPRGLIRYMAEYSDKNQILLSSYEYPDNSFYKDEYIYDEKGRETGHLFTSREFMVEYKNYKHDINGNITYQERHYYGQGDSLFQFLYTFTYDGNDRLLSRQIEGVEVKYPSLSIEAWAYNNQGLERSYRETSNGELVRKKENYTYDEHNNLLGYSSLHYGIDKEYKPYVYTTHYSFTYRKFSFLLPK